jgi:hypothetical protein
MPKSSGPAEYVHGEVVSFGQLCPDLANRELLQLFVPPGQALPQGHYAFLEFYCPDPECDCQVVMWHVIGRQLRTPGGAPLATLSWCWAPDDPHGPAQEPAPQSTLAPLLLGHVEAAIRDQGYGERIKAHYAAVREEALRPGSPVYRLLHR